MGNITIQGDLTGDVPGGEVGGASNLTTVGAIPYVSAAGILNQTANLSFDVANNRLVLGSATVQRFSTDLSLSRASAGVLQVGDGGSNANGTVQAAKVGVGSPVFQSQIENRGSGNQFITAWTTAGSSDAMFESRGANSRWFFGIANAHDSKWSIFNVNTSAYAMQVHSSTNNLTIGTTTDSNFKLDVATSGSAGTARFYGGSGVSNSTKVVVQAGGGQSGNLQEWQAANGSVSSYVTSAGLFVGPDFLTSSLKWSASATSIGMSSDYSLAWSNNAFYNGTKDLSLSRASAGVLQVGDGGSNANGTVSLTRSQHAGVLVAALPAAAAGNAGSIQYVTDANSTSIGSTVAGGGANKVMVWSDGAAWKIFAS